MWPDLLRLAALRFSIPPEAFWRLSLKEWRALTGECGGPALTTADLSALIALYPDRDP